MTKKLSFKEILLSLLTLLTVCFLTNIIAPKVFFAIGKIKLDKKNYNSAQYYFYQSLLFRPNDSDYRYYYAKTLIELPQTYDIQKKLYVLAQDNINDGADIIATNHLQKLRREILASYSNNYIEQAPQDSNIIRWSKKSFPLKVYVQKDKNLPDYYKSAISNALKQWDDSFDFVSFTNAYNKADADISIEFKDIPKNACDSSNCLYITGYTMPKVSNRTLKKMIITLHKSTPNGDYFSDSEIYNTILHELGHALGILGHSYSTEDLMYQQASNYNPLFSKFRNEYQHLTRNDINTLNLLYRLEPNITDKVEISKNNLIYTPIILGNTEQMINKKIIEHKKYIEKSPHIATGYINLAGLYIDSKQYNKALNALKQAADKVKSDDEMYIIYYNCALIHYNLKEPKTALEYANLALEIKNTDEARELISLIKNGL